ncbi:protein vav-like isoform X2 [Panonychus citri]|nr:protein vav-like isoform X2 [Panonychus citri]XP_053200490.1 protein vav-like isoform X2 [Panonychus citri]XP_053200491.1 protein vav-like isoform X2 [Panonychus citri]
MMTDSPRNVIPFQQRTRLEDIYEDLCYVTLRIGKDALEEDSSSIIDTTPLENRDYCIKELIETEKNYVDALNMIIRHFVKPLKKILQIKDRKIIFNHIKELSDIHTKFHRDLCRSTVSSSSGHRVSSCFLNWKEKFVLYGDYCANLPRAQGLIDQLCSESTVINECISLHEMEANDGKFKLRDLLSLPMQRILKYHLFLKELMKNTLETHEDYFGLQQAYEAMIDIGDYINEVKRDSETLQIIAGIQMKIIDFEMPENTELKDYGRLLRDGEVKIKFNDRCLKSRYVFVFDKVMLMCKSLKGDQFSYKEALILSDFSVDDCPPANTTGTIKHFKDKWSHHWMLIHNQARFSYTFYVKSEDLKRKWIDALDKAQDNVNPLACRTEATDHVFIMFTFPSPTTCGHCDKLLPGLFFQGYKCTICEITVHKSCIPLVNSCGELTLPPRPPLPSISPSVISAYSGEDETFLQQNSPVDFIAKYDHSHNQNPQQPLHQPNQQHHHHQHQHHHQQQHGLSNGNLIWPQGTKVKAITPFDGELNRNELSFSTGDILLITNPKPEIDETNNVKWLEGELLRTGVEGLFPADKVQPINLINHSRSNSDDSTSTTTTTLTTNNSNNPNINHSNNNSYTSNSNSNFNSDDGLINSNNNNINENNNYVNLNLEEHPWFGGTMDRETAQLLLEKLPNTTFLLRISPKQRGNYAISLNCNGIVKHMRICKTPEGQFYLSEFKFFDTVEELVNWYQERTLAESFSGLNLKLGIPYKSVLTVNPSLGYAIALYSFTGNSANLLSLRRGDYIAILSKTGAEKGWWKGQIGQRIGYFPFAYVSEIKDSVI